MNITGVDLTHSGLRIPPNERYTLEPQKRADYAPENARDSDPDNCSISNDSLGESDIDSAVGDAMKFLSELDNSVDFSSNQQGRISRSISPLDNGHLSALPKQVSDASQLPLSPESCQASSKRKLFPAVESQSDQSSRNLRPRLTMDERSCQSDDTCENARKTSPLLGKINPRYNENSPANSGASLSGRDLCKPTQDRWNGRFSCHSVLSDLSSAAKDEIESRCDQILRPDFALFMEKHIPNWISAGFWHSSSLEAVQSQNHDSHVQGHSIWRYVEAIPAEEETYYLKSRLAYIRLYLNYIAEFNRQKQAGHPDQTAKIKAIDMICGSGSLPKAAAAKIRKRFHERKLIGERWW